MKKIYTESRGSKGRHRPKVSVSGVPEFMFKGYRKLVVLFLAAVLLLFGISCMLTAAGSSMNTAVAHSESRMKAPAGPKPDPPGLWADAAILTDAESGRTLYEKNAHVKLPMASTTKMMTALVVRDQLDLDDEVTVSPGAAAVGEQTVGLVAGEKLSVEDLLWSVLVLSANDASTALAESTAGSVESFVNLMNKKAESVGAVESHFVNPHGLDQSGHYSTAYDLALMGRELLEDPVLARMVAARSHNIPGPPGQPERTLVSHNEILGVFDGANGIKTGYTGKAGWCLVASATREEKSLISVVLNSSHRADDTTALMNYGFSQTVRVAFVDKGQKVGRSRVSAFPRRYVNVVGQKDMGALTLKGSGDVFRVRIVYSKQAPPKVEKGSAMGTVESWLNDGKLERGKVVAARSVDRTGPIRGAFAFLWYSLCWMGKIISAPFRIF